MTSSALTRRARSRSRGSISWGWCQRYRPAAVTVGKAAAARQTAAQHKQQQQQQQQEEEGSRGRRSCAAASTPQLECRPRLAWCVGRCCRQAPSPARSARSWQPAMGWRTLMGSWWGTRWTRGCLRWGGFRQMNGWGGARAWTRSRSSWFRSGTCVGFSRRVHSLPALLPLGNACLLSHHPCAAPGPTCCRPLDGAWWRTAAGQGRRSTC